MQRIGWEPVASTNHTDNCMTGEELEYDYEGMVGRTRGLVLRSSWLVKMESAPMIMPSAAVQDVVCFV
jgi:hypothetical protein